MTMPMPFHHQQQPHLSRYQYQPMKVFGLGPVFSARRVTSINPAVSERKIRAEPMPRALMLTPVKSAKEQLTLNATKAQELCAQPVKSAFKRVRFAKKRVTLNPTVSVHEICAKPITKEEKSELYYTKDDYDMTILEVKAIALTHQLPHVSEEDTSTRSNCMVAAEADGFLRGIELLIYPQRFQNKLVARRALIKYQTHLETNCNGVTPEQKAKAMRMAGEKLSAWSHLVAKETARLDSLRAYDADYLIPLNDATVKFSSYPDVTFKKRESGHEVKRVTPTSEDPPRPFKKARAIYESAA
mmetsp:Transcript_3012/g.4548  ORF Transcript_3012/g.4548 Transcript_3012/m.4548 type:complete len:300 (+) Transcript_3012:109-1008(+)